MILAKPQGYAGNKANSAARESNAIDINTNEATANSKIGLLLKSLFL